MRQEAAATGRICCDGRFQSVLRVAVRNGLARGNTAEQGLRQYLSHTVLVYVIPSQHEDPLQEILERACLLMPLRGVPAQSERNILGDETGQD